MKLTKHRLKEIIGQELEAMDDPASELEDLIGLSGKAIKEAIAKIEEVQSLLAALTDEPHKVGEFVALRTRARMVDNALEDLLERYTIAVGNAMRWREEG